MQTNITTNEVKIVNENFEENQTIPPPPTYENFIEKYRSQTSLPPNYTDINGSSVVYINNYPGPPVADGVVQMTTSNNDFINQEISQTSSLSKSVRTYLIVTGILIIIFGLPAIGIQIGLIASHAIVYYYYGFWAGVLIITVGVSTILLVRHHRTYNLSKYFRTTLYQTIFVAVVFGFGLIIMLTDTCDGQLSEEDGSDDACKRSYKILNGILIAVISLTLLQTIVNTFVFGYLKRRYIINVNLQ